MSDTPIWDQLVVEFWMEPLDPLKMWERSLVLELVKDFYK